MSTLQSARSFTDKLAISLSLLCAIHCLVLPLALVLLPSLVSLNLENEAFHTWMVILVIPTSIYALTMGCKEHKNYRFLALGIAGLALLLTAVVLEEPVMTETLEKLITLVGTSLIALSHIGNYRLCKKHSNDSNCHCHESS